MAGPNRNGGLHRYKIASVVAPVGNAPSCDHPGDHRHHSLWRGAYRHLITQTSPLEFGRRQWSGDIWVIKYRQAVHPKSSDPERSVSFCNCPVGHVHSLKG